jgi:serine/threonine-protein kinase
VVKISWGTFLPTAGALATVLSVYASRPVGPPPPLFPALVMTYIVSGTAALVSSIVLLGLRQRHRDVDTEFWSRIWIGRVGRAAFRLAARFIPPGVRQSAMTHRATELSLGMAAEQLYDSLPRGTRDALGNIPALLKRLQDDAQALRRRHESVNDALAEAGDAAAGGDYADVRAIRDELHARLADTVGALETLRLNLLRLHAGSATVESVTTHLGLAAEVSEEVERLIAAQGEVEQVLKFPRTPATTPV